MIEIVVTTAEQLKAALKSDATRIIIRDQRLAKRLQAIETIKKRGPIAVAAVLAAVPILIATGGLASPVLLGAVGVSGAIAIPSITWLAVAFGGVILTSLFTKWTYVNIAGIVVLERR